LTSEDRGLESAKLLEAVMARHHYAGHALIEVLHAAQQIYGCLTPPLLREVARKLKLPPSRVLGVATFYHLFRFAAPEEHTAVVCMGTACYVEGSAELLATVNRCCSRATGWTIEAGRCVGSCGLAPVVICDGEPLSRVNPATLETKLLSRDRKGVGNDGL